MSQRWLPAMEAQELNVVAYADIWKGITGARLASGLQVVAGSVTIDRSNAVRRSASGITFLPDAAGVLLPLTNGGGALYPAGVELALYKGCRYSDGTTEFASLGRYLLEGCEVNDDVNGVTLVGAMKDRAETVTRAAFASPVSTDGTSTTDAMIRTLIGNQVAGLTYSFSPTTLVPPVSVFRVGDNAWQVSLKLAAAAGMELFFDQNGVCVLQPIVDPLSISSCASYLEGTPAAPVAIKRSISNAAVPNVCCVTSSGSGVAPPLQTYWWDNNPLSKTFYASGTPGPTLPARDPSATYPTYLVPITTSVATTQAQVQAIANAAGLGYLGSIEGCVLSIRDNPAHDANDVVTLLRAAAGIKVATKYVVDHVQIDMTTQGPLQLTTRMVV